MPLYRLRCGLNLAILQVQGALRDLHPPSLLSRLRLSTCGLHSCHLNAWTSCLVVGIPIPFTDSLHTAYHCVFLSSLVYDTCYYYIHLSSIHPLTLPSLTLGVKTINYSKQSCPERSRRERYTLSLSLTGPLGVTRASQKGRCASIKEMCHISNDRNPESLGHGGVQLAEMHTVPARSGGQSFSIPPPFQINPNFLVVRFP